MRAIFVGCEASQGLQATPVVIGVYEDLKVLPQFGVGVVMVAFDGGLFDRSVHPLDLAIGPRVVRLGEAVLDAAFAADLVEAVDAIASSPAIPVARQVGALDAIIGQDRVQVVRDCFEPGFQE